MNFQKIFFSLVLNLIGISSFAQIKPVVYGGVDYYRNTGFVSNAYANVNVGTQIFRWNFLAPEIGFEYYFGSLNDREELNPQDPNGRPPSRLESRFSSSTFSLAPKIVFGNSEAALVFIPQYNFGKITARGDLLKDTGKQYVLDEQQRVSGTTSFWSFAAGVEGQFWESNILSFCLLLKYSHLDSKGILGKIDVGEPEFQSAGGSADGLGVSFRVYFHFLELIK